jgi:hypothetical protein
MLLLKRSQPERQSSEKVTFPAFFGFSEGYRKHARPAASPMRDRSFWLEFATERVISRLMGLSRWLWGFARVK